MNTEASETTKVVAKRKPFINHPKLYITKCREVHRSVLQQALIDKERVHHLELFSNYSY